MQQQKDAVRIVYMGPAGGCGVAGGCRTRARIPLFRYEIGGVVEEGIAGARRSYAGFTGKYSRRGRIAPNCIWSTNINVCRSKSKRATRLGATRESSRAA